jgi:hypothetical protein
MPAVELGVGLMRGQITLTLTAIIDSGSDATILPTHYLQQVGAVPVMQKWLRGIRGGRHQVDLSTIFVQIGGYGTYARVVGDDLHNEVIVGRDILNQLIVTLNGLASTVEISQ